MLKRLVKLIAIILLPLLLIFVIYCFFIYPIFNFQYREADVVMYSNAVVAKAMHIPYQSYRIGNKPYTYKDGWGDLEAISYDEWFGFECEHPKLESYLSKSYLATASAEEKKIQCVLPVFWGKKHPYVNKTPKHCTSIFNCSSIDVTFYDYILQYPKVLNNVIKIMEKPCDYLYDDFPVPMNSSAWYMSDEDWDKLVQEDKHMVYNTVRSIREHLYCDTPKHLFYEKARTYSVIYILDKNGNKKTEIIVPRKDNAHLVKNKK